MESAPYQLCYALDQSPESQNLAITNNHRGLDATLLNSGRVDSGRCRPRNIADFLLDLEDHAACVVYARGDSENDTGIAKRDGVDDRTARQRHALGRLSDDRDLIADLQNSLSNSKAGSGVNADSGVASDAFGSSGR